MDRLEQVAKELHDAWREHQSQQGRVLGPERTARTHPHLVPWSQLDRESQNQDRFIAAVILDGSMRGSLTSDQLPRAIHDAWCRWIQLAGRTHPHAKPFEIAHSAGSEEHELQARRLESLLRVATKAAR